MNSFGLGNDRLGAGRWGMGDGRWALGALARLRPESRARNRPRAYAEDRHHRVSGRAFHRAAVDAAPRFGLKAAEAKVIPREVIDAVSGWRKTGKQLRIKASTIDVYATAFEHPLRDDAHQLL